MNKLRALALVGLLLVAAVSAGADTFINFESGKGKAAQSIGTIGGATFGTTTGKSLYYADIDSHYYNLTSDNGKSWESGEYFISGNAAAYAADLGDIAKISFLHCGSFVSLGYSSQFDVILSAYDSLGNLLGSSTGAANVKSTGGTGLKYLTVNGSNISYVTLQGTGGYWIMDNLTTDAPVPEPASLITLSAALVGLGLRRKKVR